VKKKGNGETNLGDLIAAAGQVAFEYSNSDVEGYKLARFALFEILKKTSQTLDSDKEFEELESPSPLIH
jgi:hypothetical protein